MKQKTKGFTLIEVLIAAVILFSALALTAELYSASSLSSNKASENSKESQASVIAIQSIKSELRKLAEQRLLSEHEGVVTVMGIDYQWTATRQIFSARAQELSDVEQPRKQFSLFNVEVMPASSLRRFPEFSFKVATW